MLKTWLIVGGLIFVGFLQQSQHCLGDGPATSQPTAFATSQTAEVAVPDHLGMKDTLIQLLAAVPLSRAACITSFETDVFVPLNDKTNTAVPATGAAMSSGKQVIHIEGTFSLLAPLYGKEALPGFGHISEEVGWRPSRGWMNPVYRRLDALTPHGNAWKSRTFVLVSPGDASKLVDCWFVGPLDQTDLESVKEAIQFIHANPSPDDAHISALAKSENAWLSAMEKILAQPSELNQYLEDISPSAQQFDGG